MKSESDVGEGRVVVCPTDTEVWLEYGWIKGDNNDHDMLWYNEGRAEEFETWYRAMMTKKTTNEPAGKMYFRMLIRPDCDIEIVCVDIAIKKVSPSWQQFLARHGNDLLIDGKTRASDWPDCSAPNCVNKVCMWAGENLCHPCTVAKIGRAEVDRRYADTHPNVGGRNN